MVLKDFIYVKIGEIKKSKKGGVFKIILGSCVGIMMKNKVTNEYALAHCLLPDSKMSSFAISAKFVNQAIPSLFKVLGIRDQEISDIDVWLFGGSNMLSGNIESQINKIGEMNINSAKEILKGLGISPKFSDFGGNKGRVVTFYSHSDSFEINILNREIDNEY